MDVSTLLSPEAMAQLLFSHVMHGEWLPAAALGLALLAEFARRVLAPKVPFFSTAKGMVVLVLVTSILGAVATALTGGAALSVAVLWQAVVVGVTSAGGWRVLSVLLSPPPAPAPEPVPLVTDLQGAIDELNR